MYNFNENTQVAVAASAAVAAAAADAVVVAAGHMTCFAGHCGLRTWSAITAFCVAAIGGAVAVTVLTAIDAAIENFRRD
jgi:hypothetical protein